MELLKNELSVEQLAAVERSVQDVCVVAGPGSGKTRVLVERFAWLVERQGVDPVRILAITFTEKAATMMKRKLVDRFANQRQIRERVERTWVMTIDAFCARLLRENAIEAGLAPDFSVLDEGSAKRMRREAAEQALDELFQEKPEQMRRLLEALALSTSDDARQVDLAAGLLEVHESMRLAGVRELPEAGGASFAGDVFAKARRLAAEVGNEAAWSHLHDWVREFLELPEQPVTRQHFDVAGRLKANLQGKKKGREAVKELRDVVLPLLLEQWILAWHSGLPELLREAVARLDKEYREAKRRIAAVDFADLEERAIELLEAYPALRGRIVNQFDHVLMDELQDTNRLQWRLIELVRRRNFFAVGDINQSIYGFRHADRTVFEGYRAELRGRGSEIDELKENYRSREEILSAVSQVLNECSGVESRELVAKRGASAEPGPVVERLVGIGEHGPEAEAELVAGRIAEWVSQGRAWGDFAILVRALHSARPLEKELELRGIPFLVSGGKTFLEARETLDLMALLAAMVNPLDEIATAGVLRGPLVGWNDEQLLRAGQNGRYEEFERLFGRARKLAGFVAPDRLLAMALDECGYVARVNDRGRANVDKFLNWIRRESRGNSMRGLKSLAELLEDLEAMRTARAEAEAPAQQAADAVSIMTIHAAKGLEFPVVFVSALHAGRNNSTPVLLFSAERGLGVKWRNPATGEDQKDATHAALSERLKADEKAEEDRLLYVAMTRAEDRLVLSYARGKRNSPWQKLAEAGIHAETAAERAHEVYAPAAGLKTSEHVEKVEKLLDPPVLEEQHDSSAAVTDVAQFMACPRKYYLGRYLGLMPEPKGPGTGAIELGLEVHKALAQHTAAQRAESRKSLSLDALDLIERFEASDLGKRVARASRVEREFDFLLALEDVVLRGQIDLWFEEGGELILVDYKTDRDESGATEYALQLRLYGLALERYAGRLPDRAALCFLRSGNVVDVSLGGGELEDSRNAVRALAAAQDALEFPMKIGEQCRRCSFYEGLCPAKLNP